MVPTDYQNVANLESMLQSDEIDKEMERISIQETEKQNNSSSKSNSSLMDKENSSLKNKYLHKKFQIVDSDVLISEFACAFSHNI